MMDKYKFDPESLRFKKQSNKYRFIRKYTGIILSGIVIGIAFLFISTYIITTPSVRKMRRENIKAVKDVDDLMVQYDRMEKVLEDLEKRDENIYKAVLESDPNSNKGEVLDSEAKKVVEMLKSKSFNEIAYYIQKEISKTLNDFKLAGNKYDKFSEMIVKKANMLMNIPSIQPVENDYLDVLIHGFGKRIDPFYKSSKDHKGIDYSLPEGTRVFATANGKIAYTGRRRRQGQVIEIDHGYSFKTVYVHLDKILVKQGQKIERGDYIGTVGNSGKSISPHLHYEVYVNGEAVNPVNFFFADISPQQYQKLIILSSRGGVSLD